MKTCWGWRGRVEGKEQEDVEAVVDDQRDGVLDSEHMSVGIRLEEDVYRTDFVTDLLRPQRDLIELARIRLLLPYLHHGHSSL